MASSKNPDAKIVIPVCVVTKAGVEKRWHMDAEKGASTDELLAGVLQMREGIARAFKEGRGGYLQAANAIVNIAECAVIEIGDPCPVFAVKWNIDPGGLPFSKRA